MRKNKVLFFISIILSAFSFWLLGYMLRHYPMPMHDYLWTWKDSIHLVPALSILISISFLAAAIDHFYPIGYVCKDDCDFAIFIVVNELAFGIVGFIMGLLFFLESNLLFYIFLCAIIGLYVGLVSAVLLNWVIDPKILKR